MMKEFNFYSLKKIELFSSLTEKELIDVSNNLAIRKFKKNEIILCEDDTNKSMYIILTGRVKVIQITEDGKEIILAMHNSGDFFFLLSLIDNKTVPATVLAIEDSIIAFLSKEDLFNLLYTHRKALNCLLQILCSRLRASWFDIKMLNFKDASQRIKILLLKLSHDYGVKNDKGLILNIKLTHQEMADMTGMTRETVTRVISKWQKNGEISIFNNKFIQLTPDFLKKIHEPY